MVHISRPFVVVVVFLVLLLVAASQLGLYSSAAEDKAPIASSPLPSHRAHRGLGDCTNLDAIKELLQSYVNITLQAAIAALQNAEERPSPAAALKLSLAHPEEENPNEASSDQTIAAVQQEYNVTRPSGVGLCDGLFCRQPECYLDESFVCVKSPHHFSVSGHLPSDVDDDSHPSLHEGHPTAGPLQQPTAASPPLPLPEPATEGQRLANFKYATSWLFRRWSHWDASCLPTAAPAGSLVESAFPPPSSFLAPNATPAAVSPRPIRSRRFIAGYTADLLYKMENVCVRAVGRLSGFEPNITTPFDGHDDSFSGGAREFEYHEHVNRIDALPEPPTCVLDKIAIFYPLIWRSNNPGHVFMRFGSALRLVEQLLKLRVVEKEEDIVFVFAALSAFPESALHNRIWPFLKALKSPWISVVGFPASAAERAPYFAMHGASDERRRLFDTTSGNSAACFKAMYLTMSCATTAMCLTDVADDRDGVRLQFPLYGPRTPRDTETMDMMRRRLSAAYNVSLRFSRAPKATRVLVAVRTRRRVVPTQPLIVREVAKWLALRQASLATLDPDAVPFVAVMRQYARADVLVGAYGCGLFWHVFMPPGSVVVEYSVQNHRTSLTTGHNDWPLTDYGGNVWAMDQHHVTVAEGWNSVRRPFPPSVTLPPDSTFFPATLQGVHVPLLGLQFALEYAFCLVARQVVRYQGVKGPQCSLDLDALGRLHALDAEDSDGLQLKSAVGGARFPASWRMPPNPWLEAFFAHAAALGPLLAPYRTRQNAVATVLFVDHCGPLSELAALDAVLREVLPAVRTAVVGDCPQRGLPAAAARAAVVDDAWRARSPDAAGYLSELAAAHCGARWRGCGRFDFVVFLRASSFGVGGPADLAGLVRSSLAPGGSALYFAPSLNALVPVATGMRLAVSLAASNGTSPGGAAARAVSVMAIAQPKSAANPPPWDDVPSVTARVNDILRRGGRGDSSSAVAASPDDFTVPFLGVVLGLGDSPAVLGRFLNGVDVPVHRLMVIGGDVDGPTAAFIDALRVHVSDMAFVASATLPPGNTGAAINRVLEAARAFGVGWAHIALAGAVVERGHWATVLSAHVRQLVSHGVSCGASGSGAHVTVSRGLLHAVRTFPPAASNTTRTELQHLSDLCRHAAGPTTTVDFPSYRWHWQESIREERKLL